MWKDFFFENGNSGLLLEDGTKVGLMFFMKDATVFQAGSTGMILSTCMRLLVCSFGVTYICPVRDF